MIVIIASITILKVISSLYSCVYRCWINGSQWIYKGPVLAILLVSTNDFIPITFTQPLPKFEGQELNKPSNVSLKGYKFTKICMKGWELNSWPFSSTETHCSSNWNLKVWVLEDRRNSKYPAGNLSRKTKKQQQT